jgi:hypothetical protein
MRFQSFRDVSDLKMSAVIGVRLEPDNRGNIYQVETICHHTGAFAVDSCIALLGNDVLGYP